MRYYYRTKSAGRCGCAATAWRVTDKYATKAELKRKVFGNVVEVWTEAQIRDNYSNCFEKIMKEAN